MTKTKKQAVIFMDTYLAVVRNSVGSKMFRNLYVRIDGKKEDITENGNLSCAIFVSSILFLFKLIKEVHATVNGTTRDLKEFGWQEIKKPKNGCVLVWAEKDFGQGSKHKHIGFYVGNKKAISNNSKYGYPKEHGWNIFDGRKIEAIFWHPNLKN